MSKLSEIFKADVQNVANSDSGAAFLRYLLNVSGMYIKPSVKINGKTDIEETFTNIGRADMGRLIMALLEESGVSAETHYKITCKDNLQL